MKLNFRLFVVAAIVGSGAISFSAFAQDLNQLKEQAQQQVPAQAPSAAPELPGAPAPGAKKGGMDKAAIQAKIKELSAKQKEMKDSGQLDAITKQIGDLKQKLSDMKKKK